MTAKMPWNGDISHTVTRTGRTVLRGSEEQVRDDFGDEHIGNHNWELPADTKTFDAHVEPKPKLHGDDVAAPYVKGIGVYTHGTVEISNEHIDYAIMTIGEWRAMNGRVEELAKLAGV